MFRNNLLYILVFILTCSASVYSQYISSIPKWARVDDITKINNIDAKKAKDGYYYVLASEQYNYSVKQRFFHYATKIVSEAGFDIVSQLEVSFDPLYEKTFFHFIRIHRNGKVIDKTNSNAFKTLNEETERYKGILNGRKTYYRNLDDLRKGDIIEYCYSISGNNPIFKNSIDNHFFLSYSVPVGKLLYRIIAPAYQDLNIKDIHNPSYKVVEKKLPDAKELLWEISNPSIISIEENTPAWYEPNAQTQISSLKNWEDVKSWCSSLFALQHKPSKLLDELVTEVVKKYPGDVVSQVTELVDFTQNQIRYSGNEQGIYSHQPHGPDFVLKNRFGDCKDKSFFLCLALEKIGIKCYPALLNTVTGEHVTDNLASLKKFDHCICAIKHNNDYVFIDPTITLQKGPFFKRAIPDYQRCMVLDSTKQCFYAMPMHAETKIVFKEYFDIDSESGDAFLKSTSTYYGGHADNTRYTFASNSLSDIQENYKSYYLKYTDEVEVADSIQTVDDTINNIFTVKEFYNLKRFWVAKDGNKEISQSILPISVNERIRYVEEASRKHPLKLYFPVNSWQEITINKQGGWNVKDETIRENNQFFDYEYKTTISGTEIILNYHYFNKTDHVLPEYYKAYKEKTDFIDKNIVFSPIQSVASDRNGSFNWLLTITLLVFLGASLYVCFKFYNRTFYYNFIEKHSSIGGWLVLVAIGICFTPLALIFQMVVLLKDDMFSSAHLDLLDNSSIDYDPLRATYSLLANGLNVFLLVSSVFMIFVFFQRKNSFRPYYVFFKCFNLVFLFIDLLVLYHYSGENSLDNGVELKKETSAFVRIFVSTCIWTPYIWFSERSRHTFTNTNVQIEPKENPLVEETNSNLPMP